MTCDLCPTELPENAIPDVDASGRPVQFLCRMCRDVMLIERAKRLGLPAPELLDVFAAHLAREIKPRLH